MANDNSLYISTKLDTSGVSKDVQKLEDTLTKAGEKAGEAFGTGASAAAAGNIDLSEAVASSGAEQTGRGVGEQTGKAFAEGAKNGAGTIDLAECLKANASELTAILNSPSIAALTEALGLFNADELTEALNVFSTDELADALNVFDTEELSTALTTFQPNTLADALNNFDTDSLANALNNSGTQEPTQAQKPNLVPDANGSYYNADNPELVAKAATTAKEAEERKEAEVVRNATAALTNFANEIIAAESVIVNTENAIDMEKTGEMPQGSMDLSGFERFAQIVNENYDGSPLAYFLDTVGQKASNVGNQLVDAFDGATLKLGRMGGTGEEVANALQLMASVAAHPLATLRSAASGVAAVLKSGLLKLANKCVSAFKRLGTAAISGLKKVPALAKKAVSGLKGLFTSQKQSNKGFSSGIGSILKYGLGIASLFTLFTKLRTAVTEGFKNLAQVDRQTNKSISNITTALTQLKNSLATAFSPILNVISPIITSFINQLSTLANTIGAVMAKLTGKSTYKKAIAAQEDYAASLDNSSSSAKNAVYAFDELNTVESDSSGGSSSPSASDMFEEAEIDSGASDIADMLKNMWATGDFTELGTILGEKLADALGKIDWSGIKAVAQKIGKSIATFINGFVEVPDLGDKIGNAIGEGLNTALSAVYGFVENLHFDSVGTFIGDIINSGLLTFDWNMLGKTVADEITGIGDLLDAAVEQIQWRGIADSIANGANVLIESVDFDSWADFFSEGISGIFNSIAEFCEQLDWAGLGAKLAEFVFNIDWGSVVSAISEAFGAALGGLGALLYGTITAVCQQLGGYFDEGILNGIVNMLKDIGNWVYKNIFTPIITGFKNAFGIHSPSTVMAEQGGFIMEGLLNGITDNLQPIIDMFNTIKTTLTQIITSLKDDIIELWQKMWNGVKGVINTFLSGVETFCNALVNAINSVFNWLNSLRIDVPDWVTDKFGISSFGFNLPTLSRVSIPKLATGTVVPRQASQFAAILGDNNRETEVVSPLSTIEQALTNALENYGGSRGGDVYISAEGDLDALVRLLKLKIDTEDNRVGTNYVKVRTV